MKEDSEWVVSCADSSIHGFWEDGEFVLELHSGSSVEAFFLSGDEAEMLVHAIKHGKRWRRQDGPC